MTQKSAKTATTSDETSAGFTAEERAAMMERAKEIRVSSRRGSRANKADEEQAVLAKIAEMPEPDRTMGERLHRLIRASAPSLLPRLWYGMPAYARDGKIVCFSSPRRSSIRGMRRWASTTSRPSMKAACGQPPSR